MSNWASGYVSDIDYVPGFYAEQMPAHLDLACLLRGYHPPRQPGEPFTYCELGCGLGETALTLAACHPEAEIHAFDFNPGHIAHAAGAARKAGLDNIHFAERSFADLAAQPQNDLPLFDYVTLHGIWTWVAREHQLEILKFVGRHVRPGGLVAVSYNALPGWNRDLPLQRLLYDFAATQQGRSDQRIEAALHFAEAMRQADASMLDESLLRVLFKRLDNSRTYLAHEYLNAAWQPVYHAAIAADMETAKLSFVASATMIENFPSLFLSAEQQERVAAAPTRIRETLRDYFNPRPFRRDIFIRGPRIVSPLSKAIGFDACRLTLGSETASSPVTLKHPIGEIEFKSPFYPFMAKALEQGNATLREIRERQDAPPAPSSEELLAIGIESRIALIIEHEPTEEERQRMRAINLAFVRNAIENGWSSTALASLGTRGGTIIPLLVMLAYEALATGTAENRHTLANRCVELLLERGEHLRDGERIIDDRDDLMPILLKAADSVLERTLPFWRRIGAF